MQVITRWETTSLSFVKFKASKNVYISTIQFTKALLYQEIKSNNIDATNIDKTKTDSNQHVYFKDSPFVTQQEFNAELEKVNDDTRIIGGSPAAAGQFPWQVAVQFRTSAGNFFCGGSLIDPSWVLTAAHCAVG